MNDWSIFLAIFAGFLVLVLIGYWIYYKNHNVNREKQPSQSPDELDNADEVTKKEILRQRVRTFITRYF